MTPTDIGELLVMFRLTLLLRYVYADTIYGRFYASIVRPAAMINDNDNEGNLSFFASTGQL